MRPRDRNDKRSLKAARLAPRWSARSLEAARSSIARAVGAVSVCTMLNPALQLCDCEDGFSPAT